MIINNFDFSKIKLLVCDFDGVMTDNKVIVREDGIESVICNRGDGLGIEMVKRKGVEVMVISKEKNRVVVARCEKLDIPVLSGINHKLKLLNKEIEKRNLTFDRICYIGNDVNDLECIKRVGIGVAVADSHKTLLDIADVITTFKGGEGAVREVCEWIING